MAIAIENGFIEPSMLTAVWERQAQGPGRVHVEPLRCLPVEQKAKGAIPVAIEIMPSETLSMMKTTVELPEPAYRQAEVLATSRCMTLKQFFTEALEEKLRRCAGENSSREGPRMASFGALSDLASENHRVLSVIKEEFETHAPDDAG